MTVPSNTQHQPVLLSEVLEYLKPKKGASYLDATAGYGGHAEAILALTQNDADAVLLDRDKEAIKALKQRFKNRPVEIRQTDFLSGSWDLKRQGRHFDLVVADLGISSPHLENTERGFSFRADAPLDMRMDQTQALTAGMIANNYSEAELAEILMQFGQEPKARTIAQAIVRHRPVKTTGQLATIIKRAWPGHSRVHPATRTFQALRIAVNDELGQLKQAIPVWIELLAPGGRLAIISFHSLEDRLVKAAFREVSGRGYDAMLKLLSSRPITASSQELVFNPRSRSARLRVAAKIKREGNEDANSGKKPLPRV